MFAVALLLSAAVFFFPPIPQDPAYHQFSDKRTIVSINNFLNVISNVPFLLVGLLGIVALTRKQTHNLPKGSAPIYWQFFIALVLVSFGSAYYHLNPDNPSLVWDRLPMTIAFMAFFCAIVGEYFSYDLGKKSLVPLTVIGMSSVLYWAYTEADSVGDLRFYVIIQFLPILLIPFIMVVYRGKSPYSRYILLVLGGYILSKLFELWDKQIYELTGLVSGHTLKHLSVAAGTVFFYLLVKRRLEKK
jgi:hypothetical protein